MKLFSEYLYETKRLTPDLLDFLVGENIQSNPEYLELIKKYGSHEAIPPMLLLQLMRKGSGLDATSSMGGGNSFGSTGFADPKATSGGLFSRPDPLKFGR